MPADASIFQNFLRAPKSVQDYDNEAMQAQSNALAMKTQQAQYNSLVQQQQQEDAIKNYLGGGANLATPEGQSGLYRVAGSKAGSILKDQSALAKDRAAADKDKTESGLKVWQSYRDQASMIRNPQEAAAWIANGYHDPVIGPYLQRTGSLEEGLSRIPQDQAGFEAWRNGVGMNVDKLAAHALQQRQFDLNANNELIGADGKVNTTLLGAKKQIAQAGASSVNINNGQKGFENELKLRGDFKQEPVYKAHQEMQSAHSQIKQSLAQASPAGDLAGATKIMKLLDPGSVVRESELGMAMAATGLLDRVQNYASNIISGNKLTPKQRQEFQQLADALYGESVKAYNSKRGEYQKLGAEYGLNADRAVGAPASLAQKPTMSTDDKQAADWANANPNDPRAAQIKKRLGL